MAFSRLQGNCIANVISREHKGLTALERINKSQELWSEDLIQKVNNPSNRNGVNGEVASSIGGESSSTKLVNGDSTLHADSHLSVGSAQQTAFSHSSRLSPLPPVITDDRLNILWPQPSFIRQLGSEPCLFPDELPMTVSPGRESIHK